MMARLPSGRRNGYEESDDAVDVGDNGKITNVRLVSHVRYLRSSGLFVAAIGQLVDPSAGVVNNLQQGLMQHRVVPGQIVIAHGGELALVFRVGG